MWFVWAKKHWPGRVRRIGNWSICVVHLHEEQAVREREIWRLIPAELRCPGPAKLYLTASCKNELFQMCFIKRCCLWIQFIAWYVLGLFFFTVKRWRAETMNDWLSYTWCFSNANPLSPKFGVVTYSIEDRYLHCVYRKFAVKFFSSQGLKQLRITKPVFFFHLLRRIQNEIQVLIGLQR